MKNTIHLMMLVTAFVLAGCAKTPDDTGKTVLKVATWDSVRLMPVLQDMAKSFEKTHPNLVVKFRRIPYGEYMDRLTASQPASLEPDVLLVSTGQTAELVARGMVAPIPNAEPYQGGTHPAGYDPDLVNYFSYNAQLFALPRDLAPVCLIYYNKALFDLARLPYPAPDWDWNQFLKTARALSAPPDARHKKRVWGFVEDWSMVEPWVYELGGRWVSRKTNSSQYAMTSKGLLAGIRFQDDLIHKEMVAPSPQDFIAEGQIGGADLFLQGQAAMFMSGPWKGAEFRERSGLNWGVVLLPRSPKGVRAFQMGGSGWGCMTTSEHPQEALELLKFLSSGEAQEQYARAGIALPALRELWKKSGEWNNPALTVAARALAVGQAVEDPWACNWQDVRENRINPILERVWNGELSVEKSVEEIDQVMKENPLNMTPPARKPPPQNRPAMFLF